MTDTPRTARRRSVGRSWLWVAAVCFAGAALGIGLVEHSEGVSGRGGVECGSVWLVTSYHSGCESWLDAASQAAFVLLGASVGVLTAGLVRGRYGWRVAAAAGVVLGLAIAVIGPSVWADRVFSTFGY